MNGLSRDVAGRVLADERRDQHTHYLRSVFNITKLAEGKVRSVDRPAVNRQG